MNIFIETGRELIRLCSQEVPDLAEIEQVCGKTFSETLNPKEAVWRSVFSEVDEESGDPVKATFVALKWITDRTRGFGLFDTEQVNIFGFEVEECESFCITTALEALHNIQLRKDLRYMNHLRHSYNNFRRDFSEAVRGKDGCTCTGSGTQGD